MRNDVDYHRITPDGAILIHSDDMSTQAKIDSERREFILARKQLVPKEACNYCGTRVPKLALWCSSSCAVSFADEKKELLDKV